VPAPRWRIAVHSAALLAVCVSSLAAPLARQTSVVDLLRSLIATGVDVLYSSELVPPDLAAPDIRGGADLMSQTVAALGALGLQLRKVGDRRYVVTRAASAHLSGTSSPAPAARPFTNTEQLEEISVFASRYVFDTQAHSEGIAFDERVLKDVPGAQSDTLRALRAAPGLASNLSARPFIRGALLGDVMVRYDGIQMVDPFHFKDFQSLLSVFDPFAVGRADVYTGGFPVKYGARSGGVFDLTPRSIDAGQEYLVASSRLTNDVATVGRSHHWPIEWLATVRVSSDNSVLQPIDGEQGEPAFVDALGRIRWQAGSASAFTVGWLALDDRVGLDSDSRAEHARVRSRDLTAWLGWDYGPTNALNVHTSFAITKSERNREGSQNLVGIAAGDLNEHRDFSIADFRSEWTYAPRSGLAWSFGAEWALENATLIFSEHTQFEEFVAASFGIPPTVTVTSNQAPHAVTLGLYGSVRRRWRTFEIELGTRLDQQSYRGSENRAQVSPRINLRFDPAPAWNLYGSWGQFVQPQRVDEWRSEENQATPDPASRTTHLIVGVAHDWPNTLRLRVEIYRNHWSVVSPYFDNLLDAVSLLPELEPDRVRIAPVDAEATGIEFSAKAQISPHMGAWATYALSRTNDDQFGRDTVRSWDQRHAASVGLSWTRARSSASFLVGWHSGWPRTPLTLVPATSMVPAYFSVGARNSANWGNYLSADLRVTRTVALTRGELSVWLDATNLSNRANDCCVELESVNAVSGMAAPKVDYWLPLMIDVGFSWRMRRNP
jgi:TonB dependent receptor/TonB-dependent Receptor Plug Domain